jgi:hypothetical protein
MERAHIEKISKALADETRLMIFEAIECHREGQFVRSRVVPETIKEYTQTLSRIAQGRKLVKKQ